MKFEDFTSEIWSTLPAPDGVSGGYLTSTITLDDADPVIIHLFRDHLDNYHMAIEAPEAQSKHLNDPGVNGLEIQLVEYRFHSGSTRRFIDLACSISDYLEEFTEVVREIVTEILQRGTAPVIAVQMVIRNWLTFWGKVNKDILSESNQIGLICELLVLEKLCEIDPQKALESWKGPLQEKHDFSFPNWSLEVKGTRNSKRIHTINGIEQLVAPINKQLSFVSFQLVTAISEVGVNLADLVKLIRDVQFKSRPDLVIKFNKLLLSANYSPLHEEYYRQSGYDILSAFVYSVEGDFPRLIPKMLSTSLSSRISDVRYDIDLTSIHGDELKSAAWEQYLDMT
ncbi:hypothetical protein Oweho_1444 [Owenweeksia hongkongensis DSM 17368]|uniref:PD-(D/E)XK motif protein n=1 Tax=Owenweeksia hongkongensis (strain DSM 17368 / CIP 108786 / JCM 12287 / NRRL B-23963 / UST20020801) TaxID=926562 RepID=G8R872_OWEHD|nr:PD-(D/E)XK motif protein [Owenweeksia hongkongensis]AEV32440.1 hypothetical protein Oweho_1444 [Owenweeksia hongkongensis DSM 17368]